ncbi:Triacylglycerol lipase [Bertholletia excelsa]
MQLHNSSSNTIILLSLAMVLLHFPSGYSEQLPLAPAIYVFGDSLVECGNNNRLPTVSRADFPPYGTDFPLGPTGRFTNGRTVADFIAEFLGLPLPPPYLSRRRRLETPTGLNYASSSCGVLPKTGRKYGKCFSLEEQINLFQKTVELEVPRYYQNEEEISTYLSKSIFVVCIGNNDYINHIEPDDLHKHRTSSQSFAHLLIDHLSQKLERLYRLGARKIVIFEIGPLGCIPFVTRRLKHSGKCVEEINMRVHLFNTLLSSLLKNLTSTLHGSAFVLGHVHWLSYDALMNPSSYGLKDSSNPCCVTWMNGTSACVPLLVPCQAPDQHYFWDALRGCLFDLDEVLFKLPLVETALESSEWRRLSLEI